METSSLAAIEVSAKWQLVNYQKHDGVHEFISQQVTS
jgi:hypothetical protein